MTRFPLLLTILGVLLLAVTATAQNLARFGIDTTETIPSGLPEGMYAPLFTAKDVAGNDVDLRATLKQSTVILVFIQGSWSRHDRKFLQRIQDSIAIIGQAPAQVIAITPERDIYLEKLKARVGAEFKIVNDADGSITANYEVNYHLTKAHRRRYNLFNGAKLDTRNAYDNRILPVPAVYVVSPSAKIVYRYFNYDRRQRPTIAELLQAINDTPTVE